ncbi:MAG: FAD-dependent monooxygenase [Bacteroidetes bacterium]|nr:FAD-dependent monooxygenase [Bacteroidota bacterium]MDA1335704.1 FAD-dependent monooxygenase [Bacteroidota bacterium]
MSAKVKSIIIDVRFPVEWSTDENLVRKAIAKELSWSPSDLGDYRVLRKNLDARKKTILAIWRIEAAKSGDRLPPILDSSFRLNALPAGAQEAHIIGAGPAGLFAALNLIKKGVRPIILERGQPVRQRRRDLVNITRNHQVDWDSNYCFGEGGAGTYSDGKLYTRSHKRGNIEEALQWLVHFGADPEILVEAHPHIGTNKLPQIIERMREEILQAGGKYIFGARLLDIQAENGTVSAIRWLDVESGKEQLNPVQKLVLATGHSARDIFELFHSKGWKLESKPFAMGVRVEHRQRLIDEIQYHGKQRGDWLPPASYRLVCQVNGRGVHSFCMCPGGIIAPCATEPDQIVTNGWSPSKRNNPFANSGMVVQIDEQVWQEAGFDGVLGGLNFQRHVEKLCWEAAGQTQQAPAQRLIDFIHGERGRLSSAIPQTSYLPGVVSVNLRELLPHVISDALAEGFREFGKRMPLFLDPQAVIVAPESRTSSPIRIPRDSVSLNHPDVDGVYPCGEGGGYAGGILSAALDGLRVSDQVVQSFEA